MVSNASQADVFGAEMKEIQERRRVVGLASAGDAAKGGPDSSLAGRDLVGVALSGGGQRSACFSLGVVQALFKSGVWQFVDYLSTVSGGGYLGGYLSSSVLKDQQRQTPATSPLMATGRTPQTADVQRFIYGGYSLLRPWELFNKYLVGLFFMNLALFSGLISLCALVAFLWRCMDYPWVRDRLGLLDLGSDLTAPFWPFWLFFFAWLLAWAVSYWRRGAEAPGMFARRLLFLTVGSGLIAGTLLLGNGDIAFGLSQASAENPAAPRGFITALIAMVVGGLLPFLHPRRLLESGLKQDKRPFEKIVFNLASTAFLVGVPLILVGIFSRENISGYSDHPGRPLQREDIDDWHGFVALYVRQPVENLTKEQADFASTFRREVLAASKSSGPAQSKPKSAASNVSAADVWPLARTYSHSETPGKAAPGVVASLKAIQQEMALISAAKNVDDRFDELPQRLQQLRHKDLWQQQLTLALALEQVVVHNAELESRMRGAGEYRTTWVRHYVERVYHFLGWSLGIGLMKGDGTSASDQNQIAQVWRSRKTMELLQTELCEILNEHVLASASLAEQFAQLRPDENHPSQDPSSANGGTSQHGSGTPQASLESLVTRATLANVSQWTPLERQSFNRRVLETVFPQVFRDRQKIRRKVVIYEDQKVRLLYSGCALGFFLLVGIWVDLNATSMHRYYRNRIQQSFLVPQSSKLPSWALSKLHTTAFGMPYHLISASVGAITQLALRGEASDFDRRMDDSDIARKRVYPFLFSRRFCGSEMTGYLPTEEYEGRIAGEMNQINLSEAIALSGAAVTPHNVQNWLVAFLMLVLNLRLGQWIPDPGAPAPKWRPTVLYLLTGFLGQFLKPPAERRFDYRFVTDGGYSDNLGIQQLLQRRCRLIIAVDAGSDGTHRLDDLAQAIRVARIHHGIRLLEVAPSAGPWRADELRLRNEPAQPVPGTHQLPQQYVQRHFSLAKIQYPPLQDGCAACEEGLLVYIKPSLTGDEGLDVRQYCEQCAEFPHQPTSDQMYDPAQVEAYRQLGYHIASEICRLLPPIAAKDDKFWEPEFVREVTTDQLCNWLTGGGLGWTHVSTTSDVAPPTAAAEPAQTTPNEPEEIPQEAVQASEEAPAPEPNADLEPVSYAEAFAANSWNVYEQYTGPEYVHPEGDVAVETRSAVDRDEVALQEWLASNELEELSESTQQLVVEGLRHHPHATTRLALVARLGEWTALSAEMRSVLREIAANDPHPLVRRRAEHVVKKRGRHAK